MDDDLAEALRLSLDSAAAETSDRLAREWRANVAELDEGIAASIEFTAREQAATTIAVWWLSVRAAGHARRVRRRRECAATIVQTMALSWLLRRRARMRRQHQQQNVCGHY